MVKRIQLLLWVITVLASLTIAVAAKAHNKVVVIPMAGDDIMPKPFSPLTKQSPPDTDYNISALTVLDKITGLEWQRIDDNATYTHGAAVQYCIDLDLAGITDWRLPLVAELQSIVDYDTHSPAINAVAFPSTHNGYWTASSYANGNSRAWGVYFVSDFIADNSWPGGLYVRCVR